MPLAILYLSTTKINVQCVIKWPIYFMAQYYVCVVKM